MKKIVIVIATMVAGFISGIIATLAVCEHHIDDPIYDACHQYKYCHLKVSSSLAELDGTFYFISSRLF